MKKKMSILFALPFALLACNNEAKDSVEKADSANEAKHDATDGGSAVAPKTDEQTSEFLVNAADGGMAEVEASQLAQQKATNAKVKEFAGMMVTDHTGANDQVKALSAARNVTLPATPGDDKMKKKEDLQAKSGADFDKAYMSLMVDDHEKTVKLFEDASGKVNDPDVKAFIDNTIPKLKAHLESAKATHKALK